jgi:hypothetical protein
VASCCEALSETRSWITFLSQARSVTVGGRQGWMRKASKCAKEAFEQIIHIQMPKEVSMVTPLMGLQRRLRQLPAHTVLARASTNEAYERSLSLSIYQLSSSPSIRKLVRPPKQTVHIWIFEWKGNGALRVLSPRAVPGFIKYLLLVDSHSHVLAKMLSPRGYHEPNGTSRDHQAFVNPALKRAVASTCSLNFFHQVRNRSRFARDRIRSLQ